MADVVRRCPIDGNPVKGRSKTCSIKCSQTRWNWFGRKDRRQRIPADRACQRCLAPIPREMRAGTRFCGPRCQDAARLRTRYKAIPLANSPLT